MIQNDQLDIFELERPLFLQVTRTIAEQIADQGLTVGADDVRKTFRRMYPGCPWSNAAGAIFRDGNWTTIGFRPSRDPMRKGSVIRIWQRVQ